VLNGPTAINSLNRVDSWNHWSSSFEWERDDNVQRLILVGVGERGLCAGGDVVAIYHSARGTSTATCSTTI
jgi:enoyl-CoA hydratase